MMENESFIASENSQAFNHTSNISYYYIYLPQNTREPFAKANQTEALLPIL